MNKPLAPSSSKLTFVTLVTLLLWLSMSLESAFAATVTWNGGAGDGKWGTGGNWAGGIAPVANDLLVFTGTIGLNNTNNLFSGTAYNGINFNIPAGPFNLRGAGST